MAKGAAATIRSYPKNFRRAGNPSKRSGKSQIANKLMQGGHTLASSGAEFR